MNVKTHEKFVLDTSALMSLLEDEDGADRVEQVLRDDLVLLPWTAILEVVYITLQERDKKEAEFRMAALKAIKTHIIWEMDEPTLLTAARWKARYRISFADAIIAAYAFRHEATLLHKDPEFEALPPQVSHEALPYK